MAIPWGVAFNNTNGGQGAAVNAVNDNALTLGLGAVIIKAPIASAVEAILAWSPAILAITWRAKGETNPYGAAIAVLKAIMAIAPTGRDVTPETMASNTRAIRA